jgi:hypothetical protein
VTVVEVFDPLLDPILDGEPDEQELVERMAVYDAYMGLFDAELDRVLFRHGVLPTEAERSRMKWITARFMQSMHTSDLNVLESVLLERFLPREQEFRLLDQELDWIIERYEGEVSAQERLEIREWVVELLEANVLLGLVDLERIYVTTVVPNRLLNQHREHFSTWVRERVAELYKGECWQELAHEMETGVTAIANAHTEETGVRALRLQAMEFPVSLVPALLAWATQPESVLHGAAGLRLVLRLRATGSRQDLLEAFSVLDRFWKIILVRQEEPEHMFWSDVFRESSQT